ncbi:hypothetical protein KAW96_11035 [candidate division WOR-3 bacterium]|nr:hypothetical protein [candidate division WOR-3 bacterium]
MYSYAIIGFASGLVVLLIEIFILEKIYSGKSRSTLNRIQKRQLRRVKEDIVEGEIEVDGDVEEVKQKIEKSLRFFYLSPMVKRVERTSNSISIQISGRNFPKEISYTVSKGWSKSVKVTYKIDFTQQKKKFKRISYFLLFFVTLPIATAIPWLVLYVISHFPQQKIQLVQLVHLWHIWWPFFPYVIYRKTKTISKTFFENILRL